MLAVGRVCFSQEVDPDPECASPVNREVGQLLAAQEAFRPPSVSTGREELQHSRGLGFQGPCGLGCGGVRCCF